MKQATSMRILALAALWFGAICDSSTLASRYPFLFDYGDPDAAALSLCDITEKAPKSLRATKESATKPPEVDDEVPPFQEWKQQVLMQHGKTRKPPPLALKPKSPKNINNNNNSDVHSTSKQNGHQLPNQKDNTFNDTNIDDNEVNNSSSTAINPNDMKHPSAAEESLALTTSPEPPANGGIKTSGVNFASIECGAKLLAVSSDAINADSLLSTERDEYLNWPCASSKWLVLQLCEPAIVTGITLGNLELFASSPKTIVVNATDKYSSANHVTWTQLGVLNAENERALQTFELKAATTTLTTMTTNSTEDNSTDLQTTTILQYKYVRYLKIFITERYGEEHFCPLTSVQVWGAGMADEDDDDEDDDIHQPTIDVDLPQSESVDPEDRPVPVDIPEDIKTSTIAPTVQPQEEVVEQQNSPSETSLDGSEPPAEESTSTLTLRTKFQSLIGSAAVTFARLFSAVETSNEDQDSSNQNGKPKQFRFEVRDASGKKSQTPFGRSPYSMNVGLGWVDCFWLRHTDLKLPTPSSPAMRQGDGHIGEELLSCSPPSLPACWLCDDRRCANPMWRWHCSYYLTVRRVVEAIAARERRAETQILPPKVTRPPTVPRDDTTTRVKEIVDADVDKLDRVNNKDIDNDGEQITEPTGESPNAKDSEVITSDDLTIEANGQSETTTVPPAPVLMQHKLPPKKKDVALLKLNNKVSDLALNVTLTNSYLQQLSMSYKKKFEEIRSRFNSTQFELDDLQMTVDKQFEVVYQRMEKHLSKVRREVAANVTLEFEKRFALLNATYDAKFKAIAFEIDFLLSGARTVTFFLIITVLMVFSAMLIVNTIKSILFGIWRLLFGRRSAVDERKPSWASSEATETSITSRRSSESTFAPAASREKSLDDEFETKADEGDGKTKSKKKKKRRKRHSPALMYGGGGRSHRIDSIDSSSVVLLEEDESDDANINMRQNLNRNNNCGNNAERDDIIESFASTSSFSMMTPLNGSVMNGSAINELSIDQSKDDNNSVKSTSDSGDASQSFAAHASYSSSCLSD